MIYAAIILRGNDRGNDKKPASASKFSRCLGTCRPEKSLQGRLFEFGLGYRGRNYRPLSRFTDRVLSECESHP
jgi:hypothetical protein